MKTYTLDEAQDNLIGTIGTPERDRFEYDLQLERICKTCAERHVEECMEDIK